MDDWFDDRKAAQVAAFFCAKAERGVEVLKLVKLIYLADRLSMEKSAYPITNDRLVSMPHGPVNSLTKNCIDGDSDSAAWKSLIAPRAGNIVSLARDLTDDDDDELSDFDLEVLESVWGEFGGMTAWQLRMWTHEHCPEWEDPNGSSNPIPHERILKFLGVEQAEVIAQQIASDRGIELSFKQMRAG